MLTKRFENLDISHFNNVDNISVRSLGLSDPTIMMVYNDGYIESRRQGFIFKDGKKSRDNNFSFFYSFIVRKING